MLSPLEVRASLVGAIAIPNSPIALDALIMWAVCLAQGREQLIDESGATDVEIPIAKSACGRIYLATLGHYEIEQHEHRFIHRRFPVAEAQALAEPRFSRIRSNAGAPKSYRLPLDTVHLVDDRMTWWCIGDQEQIAAALSFVQYVGKKRGVGLGKVARWEVAPCAPWDGFPVVRDGQPLRSLPTDFPGLRGHLELSHRVLAPPYWRKHAEELCAVPRWAP